MRGLLIILALGTLVSVASCRDNRMSESFDDDEASNDYGAGTGGSGRAIDDLNELGAHGSTGADDETLDSIESKAR